MQNNIWNSETTFNAVVDSNLAFCIFFIQNRLELGSKKEYGFDRMLELGSTEFFGIEHMLGLGSKQFLVLEHRLRLGST